MVLNEFKLLTEEIFKIKLFIISYQLLFIPCLINISNKYQFIVLKTNYHHCCHTSWLILKCNAFSLRLHYGNEVNLLIYFDLAENPLKSHHSSWMKIESEKENGRKSESERQ